eukprot:CAMPEP_0197024144 /NCGR_PEP_ID=MMETSP1384-20130603/4777_1 /TAXON_ID=29189 /ORGANISM="Ammonia sp." /LENGTH=156 /DNA_ID=CAMNT_0042452487 /DNA_START=93 /DNA_END=563 /DNA_ORIENTATION=+
MADPFDAAIVLAFITSFFWFKTVIQNNLGASSRKVAPEDVEAFGIEQTEEQKAVEFTTKDRWTNINGNDRENVQYTLFLMFGNFFLGNEAAMTVGMYASICYVVFRLLHTIFYLKGINGKPVPLRSLCFGLGQLSALTLAIMLPVGAVLNKVNSSA